MIPFNNHNSSSSSSYLIRGSSNKIVHNQSGFLLIEIMASIALLAIFGTSLFLTQATIAKNTYKTHQAFQAGNSYQQYLEKFNISLMQALAQNKPFENLQLQETHSNPDYTIQISLKLLPQSSQLFTAFGKDNYRVEIKVTQQDVEYAWHTFIHINQPKSAKA